MIRSALKYLLILGAMLFTHEVQAQLSYPADSSEVSVRTADPERLQELTDENVFAYQEIAQNPETLLDRLRRWFFGLISTLLEHPWASVIIKVIFFPIFGIVLAALVNQLLGGHLTSGFSRSKPQESFDLNIQSSSIFDRSYEELLSEALEKKHYRDAVRILYIMALKQLNEREMISWKPDKTNHDYLTELGDHPSGKAFHQLTTYYEYVEYGDFHIEESGYHRVYDIYRTFLQRAIRS